MAEFSSWIIPPNAPPGLTLMLNIDRPPGASLTPGIISTQTSGWSCSVCTFINKPSNDKCDMCGTECARIGRDKIHHNGLNDTLVNEHEDAITEAWQLEPSFVEDESSDGCFKCNTKFTWRNRRHHCKSCGLLFCSNCSSKSLQFIIAFEENFKRIDVYVIRALQLYKNRLEV